MDRGFTFNDTTLFVLGTRFRMSFYKIDFFNKDPIILSFETQHFADFSLVLS
jgi:hypothetical protein